MDSMTLEQEGHVSDSQVISFFVDNLNHFMNSTVLKYSFKNTRIR